MGNRLLLADDSITIQKVVGIIFANEDYELTIVDNGNAALEKAAALKPDVMLVDALMPGKSGYEVCEAVRCDPLLKATPILLLTGAFEPFDEDKARQSGADDFISKPFESQHLIEKVKSLIELGKHRASAAPVAAAAAPGIPAFVETPAAPAADIWGEAPEAAPIAFEAPAAAEPATMDMADAFSFADVNPDEDAYAAEVVAAEEPPAAAEDDLWGAFELEEVPAGEEAGFGTVVEVEEVAPAAAGAAEIDPFSFGDFEEPQPEAPAEPVFATGYPEEAASCLPEGEQTFAFEEEPPAKEVTSFVDVAPFAAAPAAIVEPEPFGFEEPSSAFATELVAESSVFAAELMAEPPAAEPSRPAPVAPAVAAPVAPAASPVAPAGEMTISEEQLAALVAKISRDIIERIAWEVVPDLAEALIRDEIRKIKEGR